MASQSILTVNSNESTSDTIKRRLSSDDESENVVPARKGKKRNPTVSLLSCYKSDSRSYSVT